MSDITDPIKMKEGDRLLLGKEHEGEWKDWFFCQNLENGNKGWVPGQYILRHENHFVAKEDYDSTELSIDSGNQVELISEINGWYLCISCNTEQIGWIPCQCCRILE